MPVNYNKNSPSYVSCTVIEHVGMIEGKYLEHQSMLSVLQDPSNGATALKHLKQQVNSKIIISIL